MRLTILFEVLHGFPQFLQANCAIVWSVRPVLKPVVQTSDVEGEDTAMLWMLRGASDVGRRHFARACYVTLLQHIPGRFQHSPHK